MKDQFPNTVTTRIPDHPPRIHPLEAGPGRPLWSVMIPVYNCWKYLPIVIESVLEQYDPGKMQIEVVDDASTDADVRTLVDQFGKGFVGYYRQPENVGSLRNFQTCIERSKGQLIHILHGDDLVKPGFYTRFEKLFENHPDLGAAFCRYTYIDEQGKRMYDQDAEMENEGILENWVERLGERQRIQYVSMVVKRNVYEALGSFYGVEYGEDWEMWMRIASRYPMGYIPEVLAAYRRHDASISGKSFLSGKNMSALEIVMDRIKDYLPEEKRDVIIGNSRKFYAHYALRTANLLWKNLKHRSGASAQVKAAWRMSRDPSLFYKILKLYTRMTLNL